MKYSIITINYNHRDGLLNTIKSVVSQTYTDYEYIIIDGGSTDGSVDIIKQYTDKITYWVSEPDKGIYNAMNKGIKQAKGEYLNFMNSGDCFYSENVLETMVKYLDVDIVSGKEMLSNGNLYGIWRDDITLMDFLRDTLPHQSTFIRHQLLEECPYDETLRIVADWAFWIEALVIRNATFRNTNEIVCAFEANGTSSNYEERDIEKEYVFHKLFPLRIAKDYLTYKNVISPLTDLIPRLNRTSGLHRLICKTANAMVAAYNLFHPHNKI